VVLKDLKVGDRRLPSSLAHARAVDRSRAISATVKAD
jgi:hypothetical protein